jgi:hypothetical protein
VFAAQPSASRDTAGPVGPVAPCHCSSQAKCSPIRIDGFKTRIVRMLSSVMSSAAAPRRGGALPEGGGGHSPPDDGPGPPPRFHNRSAQNIFSQKSRGGPRGAVQGDFSTSLIVSWSVSAMPLHLIGQEKYRQGNFRPLLNAIALEASAHAPAV